MAPVRVWARVGARAGRAYRSLVDVVEDAERLAGETPPGRVGASVWSVDAPGEGDPLRVLVRGGRGGWRWYDAEAAPADVVADARSAMAAGARAADAAFGRRPTP